MTDFVLVRHENGIIAPVPAALAARKGFDVVEGSATRPDGRLVAPVRDNGRPVKPPTTVAKAAAKKSSGGNSSSEEQAVTPNEGAAETTLTTTKE